MAEPRFSEKCKVTISDDNMSATLFIEPPQDGIAYSVEELSDFVKIKGVYGGVIFSRLEAITQENIYYKDELIAKGIAPKEGEPGYFEYFFDQNKNKKPLIRSDGSVDYQSMSAIENVKKGEKLIVYHPAKQGVAGVDVRGRSIRCNPCKDLPPIKGSGFIYDEDTGVYSAETDGRVEFSNNTLYVRDVYEHKGDVDFVVGRLDFRGDIVIHGNVLPETFIRASKTITVDGSVEGATLIAEGDIIIKKGLAGDKKAFVSSGGSVYANFIEFATVEAKENVEANIIMNSKIYAGKEIVVSGKRGVIVGGNSYAVGTIKSTLIGNVTGHKTIAIAGTTKDIIDRHGLLETKLRNAKKSLEQINAEIQKLSDNRISYERRDVQKAKLSQLNRRKVRDERMVEHIQSEMREISEKMEIASGAKISATNTIHSGTKIVIDSIESEINSDIRSVEFFIDKETGELKSSNISG